MAKAVPSPLAAVAVLALLLLCRGAEARVLLTLDDFGGVGDGIANDTQALLDAWAAACSSTQEAVLAVPAGKVYQIWPVQLSGPCKKRLKLLISGAIVAPSSPDEWAGRDPMKWLYVYGVDGLSVSGGGTIDGMGQQWWASTCKRKKTQPCYSGPRPKVNERSAPLCLSWLIADGGCDPSLFRLLRCIAWHAGGALRGVPGGERAGRDAAERAAVPADVHALLLREGQLPPGGGAGGQPQHRRHPPQRHLPRPHHGQPHLHRGRLRLHGRQLL
uniref:Polygalacturonase n=1 Tax=Zea mays TaxID=4577 RepID=C0P7Z4_MAIZE|nr:unknown [Zea mays]